MVEVIIPRVFAFSRHTARAGVGRSLSSVKKNDNPSVIGIERVQYHKNGFWLILNVHPLKTHFPSEFIPDLYGDKL